METEAQEFVTVCADLFKAKGFKVESEDGSPDRGYDFVIVLPEGDRVAVEVKYYTQIFPATTMIKQAILNSLFRLSPDVKNFVLITSTIIDDIRKVYDYGGIVLDGYDILKYSEGIPEVREKLLQLLPEGVENYEREGKDLMAQLEKAEVSASEKPSAPSKDGRSLCSDLTAIKPGFDDFRKYETKVKEILVFLFRNDLVAWSEQPVSDDGLNRFDLICRIRSRKGFWNMLLNDFSSRYVLFEFKNYNTRISPKEVLMTERYLYTKANRAIAFIVSRMGPSPHAVRTSNGALRENGKLILHLSDEELCQMLSMADEGDDPCSLLFEKIDKMMTKIER